MRKKVTKRQEERRRAKDQGVPSSGPDGASHCSQTQPKPGPAWRLSAGVCIVRVQRLRVRRLGVWSVRGCRDLPSLSNLGVDYRVPQTWVQTPALPRCPRYLSLPWFLIYNIGMKISVQGFCEDLNDFIFFKVLRTVLGCYRC